MHTYVTKSKLIYSVEPMRVTDWEKVQWIYADGLKTGISTFQTEVPTWQDWNQGHLPLCRLTARCDQDILGWVALSPTSSRPCYQGVVEVSLYVGAAYRGQGVGEALLTHEIIQSEKNGIWMLYCSIIRENKGSIALTEKCGFRKIGIREKIAKLNTVWHDTVLMERRSKIVGF